MCVFSRSALLAIVLSLHSGVYAQLAGLKSEIQRFVNQVDEASPAVQDAMTSFISEYSSGAAVVADRSFDFTTGTENSITHSPIATIRYGYVDDFTNFFVATGADNSRMYALEVTFKTAAQYADIHPSLAGKTVLFIAHGVGPVHKTIYTIKSNNSNLPGTQYLANHDEMSRIGGFTCQLKNEKCTSSTGTDPVKTCDGTNQQVNSGRAPGMIINSSNNINLFYYVNGPFSLCADQKALKNEMG